ncbi:MULTISPECIES: hypothetical protein [Nocardiaceae]|nr:MULTISPECIES: hypothetical protein [Rhodococcus]
MPSRTAPPRPPGKNRPLHVAAVVGLWTAVLIALAAAAMTGKL